jgi:hypothetical protein
VHGPNDRMGFLRRVSKLRSSLAVRMVFTSTE